MFFLHEKAAPSSPAHLADEAWCHIYTAGVTLLRSFFSGRGGSLIVHELKPWSSVCKSAWLHSVHDAMKPYILAAMHFIIMPSLLFPHSLSLSYAMWGGASCALCPLVKWFQLVTFIEGCARF